MMTRSRIGRNGTKTIKNAKIIGDSKFSDKLSWFVQAAIEEYCRLEGL